MGHLLSSISPLTIKAANEAVRESTHVKGHGQYLTLNTKIKTAKQQNWGGGREGNGIFAKMLTSENFPTSYTALAAHSKIWEGS